MSEKQTSTIPFSLRIVGCWICTFAAVAVSFGQGDSSSNKLRAPIPSMMEIKVAEAAINEAFKEELKLAKRPKASVEKKDLASKFLAAAKDSSDDKAAQYLLLREAQKLYEEVGDVANATKCIDAMAKDFDVNSAVLRIKLLDDAVVKTPGDLSLLAETAVQLIEKLQGESDYESASQAIQAVQSQAGKAKDRVLQKQMLDLKQDNLERRAEYDSYRAALSSLARTPDDKNSNLIAGKYACLVLGDWDAGLSRLLKAEGILKAIADKEALHPTDIAEVLDLGDSWWSAAESEKGITRVRLRREAGYWYRRALPSLSGIKRAVVEKKLLEIKGKSLREEVEPGLIRFTYSGTDFEKQIDVGLDAKIYRDFGFGGVAQGLPVDNFSIRWSGLLRIPETAVYTIGFEHDDGGRLWIDGKQVVDNWRGGIHHDAVEMRLAKGDHPIKIEFYEGLSTAGINLWWKSPLIEREVIPPSAFFHSAADGVTSMVK